jgi:hypothetical protein
MERWLPIDEFPGYSVSNHGRVRNDATNRILIMVVNQAGVLMVGLVKGGRQYKRGVAKMVAERWLPHNTNDAFDTPMHLDGDRTNCAADNLVWRPRAYTAKYLRQFEQYRPPFINCPIEEVETGTVFPNSWEAAKHYGLREYEVAKSYHERTTAWPTLNHFRKAE